MTQIVVPTLGESVSEATVAQWLKKEGEKVSADEPIVELETDKVTLEVNAPEDGVISKIVAQEGSNVEVGALLGEIGEGAAANDTKPAEAKKEEKKAEAPKEEKEEEDKEGKEEKEEKETEEDHKLSPAVRKLVDEHNLDPSKIEGTGKDGRLVKEDVLEFIEKKARRLKSRQQKWSVRIR